MASERVPPNPVAAPSGTSSSTNIDVLPRGRLARDISSTNVAATAGGVATVCTASVTNLPANRTVDIDVKAAVRSNIAGGIQVSVYEDGVQIERADLPTVGAGIDYTVAFKVESQPSSGAHAWTLVVGSSGGSNVVTSVANGGSGTRGNSAIYVTDQGDSY